MTRAACAISPPNPARRHLALWFPFLPTERLSQSLSAAQDEPLVLVEKARNALRIASACPRAQAMGLLPGLPLADARARAPLVQVHPADPEADARLLLRLAAQCARWSPMVAADPPDGLLLDISGCAHLFGGETGLAAEVGAFFGVRFSVRHAFAATPSAAHALARFAQQGASADADEEAAILQLPVAALRLGRDVELALRRAGLKRVGDLASRPTAPLSARFGAAATDALERLLGRADSRIVPLRPSPALHFARRFAEPICHADSIRMALEGLTAEAVSTLERRAQGGRAFSASFFRSDGAVRDLAIETGQPTRDPALIGRLFHERIEGLADPLDPGFGFDLIRLSVPATEPLAAAQPDLDARPERAEALEALIDRLSVRHGRGRILRMAPVNSHVPERAERLAPALDLGAMPSPGIEWPDPPAGEPPLRPLFLLDPPQPVEAMAEMPDAPPRQFRWKGVSHQVVRAEGPERIAAPWWKKSGEGRPTRDYYRVEDSEGRRFWLFRKGLYGREAGAPCWFLHGLFA